MAVSCWYFTASAFIRRINSSSCRAIFRSRGKEVMVSLVPESPPDTGLTDKGLDVKDFFTGAAALLVITLPGIFSAAGVVLNGCTRTLLCDIFIFYLFR